MYFFVWRAIGREKTGYNWLIRFAHLEALCPLIRDKENVRFKCLISPLLAVIVAEREKNCGVVRICEKEIARRQLVWEGAREVVRESVLREGVTMSTVSRLLSICRPGGIRPYCVAFSQPPDVKGTVSSVQVTINRTMATASSEKILTIENLNPCIKVMEYAVRGPLVIRATEIEKELEKVRQATQKKFSYPPASDITFALSENSPGKVECLVTFRLNFSHASAQLFHCLPYHQDSQQLLPINTPRECLADRKNKDSWKFHSADSESLACALQLSIFPKNSLMQFSGWMS